MSVTYTATLPAREETVFYLAGLLRAECIRRGTRTATRCLDCFQKAMLVLRWLLNNTRLAQLEQEQGEQGPEDHEYAEYVSTRDRRGHHPSHSTRRTR